MAQLSQVIHSNSLLSTTFPQGLTAVFIGGTNGVGEYTLKALAKYVPNSTFYIVGRSEEAAQRIKAECSQQGTSCSIEFIKADVGPLEEVDVLCRKIMEKTTSINLLFLTVGTMAFKRYTRDGIPLTTALGYYSRIRAIQNLLPLVQRAKGLRRVVSVGAATCEGAIDLEKLSCDNMAVMQFRDQVASMMTLGLEEVAKTAPDVSFVHTVPGVVDSGITREAQGFALNAMLAVVKLLKPFIATAPGESGERHAFAATSGIYPPAKVAPDAAAVEVPDGLSVARGSTGAQGTGVYSVGPKNEDAPQKAYEVLKRYRADGTAAKVWERLQETFDGAKTA